MPCVTLGPGFRRDDGSGWGEVAPRPDPSQIACMDLDQLLDHYFGSSDPDAIAADRLESGKEQLALDFGIERDPSRKFALWTLMDALGFAPVPAEAFEKFPALRRAAENYLSVAWRIEGD